MKTLSFQMLVKQKYSYLSTGQKKVAKYLVENLDESAFKTAFQIGKEAKVSETTVIRLSYALGFEGFSKMQGIIQKQMLQQNQTGYFSSVPVHSLKGESDPFTKIIDNEIHILRHLLHHSNVQNVWKAVDALIEADQILIAGQRISHAGAYWFSYTLNSLRENVNLVSHAGDFYEKFTNLTSKSVVVVFSFPRYANETVKIAECAKNNGVTLLSVTDRLLSPVGSISDITLTTEENAEKGTNSIASVITLLELVVAGIYEKDQKRIQSYQQKLEKLYSIYEVFHE
ncbi:MurR/RpiR family transcriptional regulator [Fictibacillus sp. NPDC058756]|uniref:MurR/RpiR family transcriptional regulator n=1 Tax=Fictibacillus sp. NPDC058756 TaxID=3346625 RepID=UPI00368CD2A9